MPIFDQGYQHWQGPLSGHGWRWLAIARHGVRVQMKNRFLRLLLLLALAPALALIAAMVLWGLVEQQSENVLALLRSVLPGDFLTNPRAYRATVWTLAYLFFFRVEMFFIMLLVVIAGPGLISRDLRFNALPLYFSRPLTRFDYFIGKLGVIGALVAAVAIGPAVFAYVVGVGFSLDLSVVKDTYPVLLASVAYGFVVTLSVGTLMLALSSLTRRSLYVGIAWAGFWIISGAVGSILTQMHQASLQQGIYEEEMARWLQGHPPPRGGRVDRLNPVLEQDRVSRRLRLAGVEKGHEKEAEDWYRQWRNASTQAWTKVSTEPGERPRDDWRPLCSYVSNLERIADQLLGAEAAWVALAKATEQPQAAFTRMAHGRAPPASERRFASQMVAQNPWQWSAVVLLGLLGISTWTLTRRVKSLDRLK